MKKPLFGYTYNQFMLLRMAIGFGLAIAFSQFLDQKMDITLIKPLEDTVTTAWFSEYSGISFLLGVCFSILFYLICRSLQSKASCATAFTILTSFYLGLISYPCPPLFGFLAAIFYIGMSLANARTLENA